MQSNRERLNRLSSFTHSSVKFKSALTENRLKLRLIDDEGAKSIASALQSPACKVTYIEWVTIDAPQ